jgi:predicted acyl esterase
MAAAQQADIEGLMTNTTASERAFELSQSGQRAPVEYDRPPTHSGIVAEKDVLVPMRDGVKIAVDVHRPNTTDKLPALLAFSIHNKDLQGPEPAQVSLTHPAWSMLWTGPAEAGDTRYLVARGYVHVIGNPRGGGSRAFDSYDLIEWIAAQPWCDGNMGMVGISGFGAEQLMAAKLKPPHLKAIFPFDPAAAGDAMDQVLPPGLGAPHDRAVRAVERRRLSGTRRLRADAGEPDQLHPEAALSERAAGADVTIAGPSVLHLYAAIDQDDTNWIVILKDVGPDVGVQTAREGECDVTASLHERELTRGWLKASHRAIDPSRSLPGRPWHPLTRAAHKPVVPGEINEYAIEIMATANQFKKDHRICVEITSLDVATGVGGATNVEYIPYHICSSKTVLHRIYHDPQHPSHLLLPVIPNG